MRAHSFAITREREGTLSIMALQLLVHPTDSAAVLPPMWSTRRLSS